MLLVAGLLKQQVVAAAARCLRQSAAKHATVVQISSGCASARYSAAAGLSGPSNGGGGVSVRLPVVNSVFSGGGGMAARQLSMISVDTQGRVRELSMTISQLKDETRLNARELLSVEQPLASSQPRILPRRHCIPFHVGHVRGVIFADRIYVFNTPYAREYIAYVR